MWRLLLPLLALTTIRPMHTLDDKCSGICGRRPLAPSHSNPFPIVGGVNTLPGAWPWMVSIRTPSKAGYQHTCGGSLIAATWVLTAAHCFKDKRHLTNWEVVFGATQLSRPGPDAEVRFPKRVVEHANYQPRHQNNDIALIELDEPVLCNDYIQPACLPDSSLNVSTMSHCYIAGWGYTHEKSKAPSDILKEAKVDLISIEKCNSTDWYYGSITNNNLCAGFEGGGIDTCQGDSGGPLLCREDRSERYWVVGVTSWGLGCARAQKPGVYTSTQNFYDWIQSYTVEDAVSEAEESAAAEPQTIPTVPEPSTQTETQTSPETPSSQQPETSSLSVTMSPTEPPPQQLSVLKSLRYPQLTPSQEDSQTQEAGQSDQTSLAQAETTLVPSTTSLSTPKSQPPRPKRKQMVVSSVQYGSRWHPNWPGSWPSNRQSNTQS